MLNKRLIWSIVVGVLAAVVIIIAGISGATDGGTIGIAIGLGGAAFTLVSCLSLGNNFVGEVMLTIFTWSFVRLPGLIFTLDLDGIIWLLTVKLLFWSLGIVLGILLGILAIAVGGVISIFVYPLALYRNIKGIEVD